MKNSIHFKNFRKFENFPRLDFNDITFVVGKNNSGKSTFVKAFVMVYNYLNSGNFKKLDLNHGSVELLNIVTFDRALCKTMVDRDKKNYIPITVKIGIYEFFLKLTAKPDSTVLDVLEFKIIDYSSDFTLNIYPQNGLATISYTSTDLNDNDALKSALAEKDSVEKEISKLTDNLSKESIELNMSLEKITKVIDNLQYSRDIKVSSFSTEVDYNQNIDSFYELQDDILDSLLAKYKSISFNKDLINKVGGDKLDLENSIETIYDNPEKFIESIRDNGELSEEFKNDIEKEFEEIRYYYLHKFNFEKFFKHFQSFINYSRIFYLPATLNKQSALLSIRDKNNDLADVVHKYHQLNLEKDPIIYGFVKHWLNEFQIGTDIKIQLVNGEAYSIDLTENDVQIPLADKGMGSIQAVLLILRLASVIYLKQGLTKKDVSEYFVIVEEPELNLHPALQSKLCDLFFEVYAKWRVKFIIETHSEYIIRKTQLSVKESELEIAPNDNPFSVIYFNDDLKVWNMVYRPDGRFSNEFGEGFFDESSNLAFELM